MSFDKMLDFHLETQYHHPSKAHWYDIHFIYKNVYEKIEAQVC